METNKIPVEFLLKMSRQECGELKSYIQELEDENKKLRKEIKSLQSLRKFGSPQVQVDRVLENINNIYNNIIPKLDPIKQNRKKVKLYKRMTSIYNAWFNGCKDLILIMNEIRNPRPSSETTT